MTRYDSDDSMEILYTAFMNIGDGPVNEFLMNYFLLKEVILIFLQRFLQPLIVWRMSGFMGRIYFQEIWKGMDSRHIIYSQKELLV